MNYIYAACSFTIAVWAWMTYQWWSRTTWKKHRLQTHAEKQAAYEHNRAEYRKLHRKLEVGEYQPTKSRDNGKDA